MSERKSLTDEEMAKIKKSLFARNNVYTLASLICLETGCRSHEAVCVNYKSFVGEAALKIYPAKGSRQRTVPISKELRNGLHGFLDRDNVLKPIWECSGANSMESFLRGMRRSFAQITFKTLGYSINLHRLRHNWVFRALEVAGNNVVAVQHAIGHKNINSTAQYLTDVESKKVFEGMSRIFRDR